MDHKVGNRHYKPLEKMDNNEIEEEDNDTEMEELSGWGQLFSQLLSSLMAATC